LAPFAPHLSEESWNRLHGRELYTDPRDSVHRQSWPTYDPTRIEDQDVSVVIQVNGKVRGTVLVLSADAKDQSIVDRKARAVEKIQAYLAGGVTKTIFIPGKLINFVV